MHAAAITYALLVFVVVLFQLALAAGVPWGEFAMGGRFRGRFPPAMRVAAVAQSLVLAALGAIVLTRAGLALPAWHALSRTLVWGVVAFGAVSVALNLATPSRRERMVWAPVAAAMLACSIAVALS
jgi:hypothetical protein